jgi:hypothetical protein
MRCTICGRFVPYGSDSATDFGNSYDVEPPDEYFYCTTCAGNEEGRAITTGSLPAHWVAADWERRAAKALGLVRAGPKLAAWGHWYARERVPDGYVTQS